MSSATSLDSPVRGRARVVAPPSRKQRRQGQNSGEIATHATGPAHRSTGPPFGVVDVGFCAKVVAAERSRSALPPVRAIRGDPDEDQEHGNDRKHFDHGRTAVMVAVATSRLCTMTPAGPQPAPAPRRHRDRGGTDATTRGASRRQWRRARCARLGAPPTSRTGSQNPEPRRGTRATLRRSPAPRPERADSAAHRAGGRVIVGHRWSPGTSRVRPERCRR